MPRIDNPTLAAALDRSRARLLDHLGSRDHWEGRLSSSALATAVATFALARVDRGAHDPAIRAGLAWLVRHQNADGGWGDTVESLSNISTTLLCWAALTVADPPDSVGDATRRAEAWLSGRAGDLSPGPIADAVLAHYGQDRTFSAPILTMCAIAGRLGTGADAWRLVPQLPFELAVLPRRLFKWLRLPVVSYALPALISIGLVRHARLEVGSALLAGVRHAAKRHVLKVLERMQPASGGFLEAVPLTAFVVMSLAAAGHSAHPAAVRGAAFLGSARREDGSWPIDSNLSVWVTTLAVNALAECSDAPVGLAPPACAALRQWLLACQTRRVHAFTGAAPGGWPWTHLPGGVPDADDTSGALLALRKLGEVDEAARAAAAAGIRWLLDLQNADGGVPTFCKGWGKLPFDRSCPDITAHVLRCFDAWYEYMEPSLRGRLDTGMHAAVGYLSASQRADGSWVPLWFGNQAADRGENPVYGTSLVISALRRISPERLPRLDRLSERGVVWLARAQAADGGWGGGPGAPPSVEETALAVRALTGTRHTQAVERGTDWLLEHACGDGAPRPAPIGLYFASLWYAEDLYPLAFTAAALARVHGGGA